MIIIIGMMSYLKIHVLVQSEFAYSSALVGMRWIMIKQSIGIQSN